MRMQIISVSYAGIVYNHIFFNNRNFARNLILPLNLPLPSRSNVCTTGWGILPQPLDLSRLSQLSGAPAAPVSEGG